MFRMQFWVVYRETVKNWPDRNYKMLNYNLSLCKISIQNYNYIWHYAAILDLSYLCNLQGPTPSTPSALSASCGLSQAKPRLNIFKQSQTNQLLTWSQTKSAPSAWFSLVQLGLDLTTLILPTIIWPTFIWPI